MSTPDLESRLVALARAELLQGIEPDGFAPRRLELYDTFGIDSDPWVEKARLAYAAMRTIGGFVASVGDELSAELDIRVSSDLYAAVGGFDAAEITHGLGTWWSPSATWFVNGQALVASTREAEPEIADDFDSMARLLLDAGADRLSGFFARVAAGGLGLLDYGVWLPWQGTRRRELALVTHLALQRSMLFRERPAEDGRYLRDEHVTTRDLVEAVRNRASRKLVDVDRAR